MHLPGMTVVPAYAAIVATVAVIVTLIALYTVVSSVADLIRGVPGEAEGPPEYKDSDSGG